MSPMLGTLDVTARSIYQLKASFTGKCWEKVSLWEAELEERARFLWIKSQAVQMFSVNLVKQRWKLVLWLPWKWAMSFIVRMSQDSNISGCTYPAWDPFLVFTPPPPTPPRVPCGKCWQMTAGGLGLWTSHMVFHTGYLKCSTKQKQFLNKRLFLIVSSSLKRLKNWNL